MTVEVLGTIGNAEEGPAVTVVLMTVPTFESQHLPSVASDTKREDICAIEGSG